MPELLRSAKLAIEKGLAPGRNESYVKQLSDFIIPALVEALHKVFSIHFCPLPPPPSPAKKNHTGDLIFLLILLLFWVK